MSLFHKMLGRAPVVISLSSLGNASSSNGSSHTFSSLAVGSGGGRTIIVMATAETLSSNGALTACTVDGNSCAVAVEVHKTSDSKSNTAAIFILNLTTETGDVSVRVSGNKVFTDWGMSFVIVTGLFSATPTDTAVKAIEPDVTVVTSTTLEGSGGGIALGVISHFNQNNSMTWGNIMTERSDINVGGTGTHRHSVGYDTIPGGRAAVVETVVISAGGRSALATAAFR